MADRKNLNRLSLNAKSAQSALRAKANPRLAGLQQKFFRTEKGGYGEGDRFIGLRVPDVRQIAKVHRDIVLSEVAALLRSEVHEDRLLALIILNLKFARADELERERLFRLYLKERRGINNWDLVDVSAPHIVGGYLVDKERDLLYEFSRSKKLWEKRIAIVATHGLIRKADLDDAFQLAEILLHDTHDLIHKAVGWTLREAGKRDVERLKSFLDNHAPVMPRTALRYAIERLPEALRKRYLGLPRRSVSASSELSLKRR